VALLGAALCLLGCARDWPPAAPQPINAVLAYKAELAQGGPPPCIPQRTQGVTFRSLFARGSEYHWELLASPRERSSGQSPAVDAALAAELRAAIRRNLAGGPPVAAPIVLRPLPAALQPQGRAGCHGDLELSAPALSGDFAFVDTLDICGENCASGTLFALRKEGDGWRLVAMASTGIT